MLGFFIGATITLITIVILSTAYPTATLFTWIQTNISSIQALGSIAIASSAIVAILLYRATIKRHSTEDNLKSSEAFLKEAKQLLEKTYSVFTDKETNTNTPRNDRLLWLTTARMIARYERIKTKITAEAHLEIIEEHEEYWRFHFYKILDQNSSNFDLNYLQPDGDKYSGNSIARKSIAVIFYFAKWNGPDPLDDFDDQKLFASKILPIDQHEILRYLEQYKSYWAEVLEIRENEYTDP